MYSIADELFLQGKKDEVDMVVTEATLDGKAVTFRILRYCNCTAVT
jgi:hypothetical protein